jgi:SAM-dependent methyltransferase
MILSQFTSAFEELLTRLKWQFCSKDFRRCELRLFLAYALRSRYRLARQGFEKSPKSPPYGHTPLSTFEKIAAFAEIKPGMQFVELGCGDGRLCFWLSSVFNCTSIGIDNFKPFIQRAQSVSYKNIDFLHADLLDAPIQSADVIYFYSTGFDVDYLLRLSKHLNLAPEGCKLITVSFPLKEIDPQSTFYLKKRRSFKFPWGTAEVFIQVKKSS